MDVSGTRYGILTNGSKSKSSSIRGLMGTQGMASYTDSYFVVGRKQPRKRNLEIQKSEVNNSKNQRLTTYVFFFFILDLTPHPGFQSVANEGLETRSLNI